ncbi:MAG TPA: 16S rRNA (guanine(966)-N(2))-methyltransferase RsmD [Gammaproteobacteria bacterium]
MRKRGTTTPREPPGKVRIIGGAWRSRRLAIPAGTLVRPTPDRVRETLFNWLRNDIEGARCLDLYAGTGALGFEALSRGAAEAWLVESDVLLVDALEEHARLLGARATIVRRNALAFLDAPPPRRFDVVFVDPPYEQSLEPIFHRLPPWLADHALIYAERPLEEGLPTFAAYEWRKQSRAGAVVFGLAAPRQAS